MKYFGLNGYLGYSALKFQCKDDDEINRYLAVNENV